MTVTDDLIANARTYAASFDRGDLPLPPAKHVAVVACMDARLNPYGLLGLSEGDAHVIRNTEIVLIHHTDCGMLTFTDDEFKASIEQETGIKPPWSAEAFGDLDADVLQSIARIKADPFLPHKESVRGFVYDVTDGSLREVTA